MLPVPAQEPTIDFTLLVKLARELAIDHFDPETILKNHQISADTWENIKNNKRFHDLLESEIAAWNSATNTHERTRLKAAALVEEYLPEGNARIHDPKENLPAKVELLKVMTRIAGMGIDKADVHNGSAEKVSITINLGADHKLKFEKEVNAPLIEGQVATTDA